MTTNLGVDTFERTITENEIVLVDFWAQPGALPAAALEQVIAAVRALDVEAALAEQRRSD